MAFNIQQLMSLMNRGQSQPQPQQPTGIDPNLALLLQGMGMAPRHLDTQGRPIVPGQTNPSLLDQHYARQANPQAMRDRYSSGTFAQGPARVDNGQAPVVARQPVTGLPGQVGPAYSLQQTPINMSPTPSENADMQSYRDVMKRQMSAKPLSFEDVVKRVQWRKAMKPLV